MGFKAVLDGAFTFLLALSDFVVDGLETFYLIITGGLSGCAKITLTKNISDAIFEVRIRAVIFSLNFYRTRFAVSLKLGVIRNWRNLGGYCSSQKLPYEYVKLACGIFGRTES